MSTSPRTTPGTGPNLVPNQYRGVSVATLPAAVGLEESALRAYFLGRPAYRRTRFVVVRCPPVSTDRVALLRVARASDTELFSPIVRVEWLAGPDECRYLVEPEADTAIPSTLAEVALRRAPGCRAVVVQGRYGHVSFIVEPAPIRVVVREVSPPEPAKLLDQARRVLAVTESLPPIELVGEVTRLADLAARQPAPHYLLPCRGSGAEVAGARVSYLDEHPERTEWTLLGCTRSRQIHRWFYGDEPPTVDFCPKQPGGTTGPGGVTGTGGTTGNGSLLTKCCLQEERLESGDGWVSVPWGASLEQVRQALVILASQREPAWSPA